MHPAWQDVGCYISKFSGEMKAPIASRLQSESNRYYLEVVIQEAVKDRSILKDIICSLDKNIYYIVSGWSVL